MGGSPVTTLIVVCCVFTSLMVVAVAIRIYTKACILRSLGRDDCEYLPRILKSLSSNVASDTTLVAAVSATSLK